MIEKIKKISNPLTIIAIFAGLAEIAGTVALIGVDKEIQQIFVWFVMLFPTLIVIFFFITLNFNARVLYAPSDFESDSSFLEALRGQRVVNASFKNLESEVNRLSDAIESGIISKSENLTETQRAQISSTIRDELNSLRNQVSIAREATQNLSAQALPKSGLQAQVIDLLASSDEPMTADNISEHIKMNKNALNKTLTRLTARGALIKTDRGYELNTL